MPSFFGRGDRHSPTATLKTVRLVGLRARYGEIWDIMGAGLGGYGTGQGLCKLNLALSVAPTRGLYGGTHQVSHKRGPVCSACGQAKNRVAHALDPPRLSSLLVGGVARKPMRKSLTI